MIILDRLLVGGVRFVLKKVVAAAEAELHDDAGLRQMLLEAQMRLELGELSEAEYRAVERDVLARLREMGALGEIGEMEGVEVAVDGVDVEPR